SLFRPEAPFRDPVQQGQAVLAVLGNDLQSPAAATRLAALWDLKPLGTKAAQHMDAVCQALHDVEPAVRLEAADVLGGLGPQAGQAVPKLLEAAQLETNRDVRQALIQAAMRLGGQASAVVPVMVKLVQQEPTCCARMDFTVAGESEFFPKVAYFTKLQQF